MKLLAKEVCFEAKQDLGSFDLAKVKTLRRDLFRIGHHWIDVWSHELSKSFGRGDDFFQYFFFFRLEGQTRNLSLPVDQVFKLWASCITRDLDTVVANGAGVVVVFFDLATSDLQALAMIPGKESIPSELTICNHTYHS